MHQRWRVGDVEITAVDEIDLTLPGGVPGSILPDATPAALESGGWRRSEYVTPDGGLRLRVQALLVQTPGARVVVDPCIGNGRRRRSPLYNMLETPFLERFARAGWDRAAVTHVVNTHLHMDHVGWNTMAVDGAWVPTFPNARYSFSRRDFDYYTATGDEDRRAMLADAVLPVVDAGLADFFERETLLTPGLRLVPTPGHSPGHASVLIESRGERAIVTGDVMHHPAQIGHPEWSSSLDVDQDASRTTRLRFLETWADGATLLIGTHFPPPSAGRVRRTAGGYAFDASP